MAAYVLQLPELLDEILECLNCCVFGRHNLYTCLFVNRQFHAHATRLLYRDISFTAKTFETTLEEEGKLRNQLCQRPAVALHIRNLFLDITETRHTYDTPLIPFETRIEPILHLCRNLRRVDLHSRTWKKSQPRLIAVLNILNSIESHPELSICFSDYNSEDRLEDDDIYERADPILRIKEKVPIKSLRLNTRWSPRKLQYISQFRQLESLSLCGRFAVSEGFGWEDLDRVFEGIPLSTLKIDAPCVIHTFPRNLRSLVLDEDFRPHYSLNYITWRAICSLRKLTELTLDYSSVDEWDDPCEFSSNLKSFNASLPSDTVFIRQLLQPIFSSSSRLTSIDFSVICNHLTPNLVECLTTSSPALSQLNVEAYHATPYEFHDLAGGDKTSPSLTRLTLPWPTSLGNEITPRTERQRRFYCKIRDGVPERLTFQKCKRLAAAFPRLDKIEFKVKKENMATTFSRYWLRGRDTPNMPFQSEKIGEWWVAYLERLQSVKMSKFIDVSSPCLNVCTLLFHFEDPDCVNETASLNFREVVILLSLDQVRKHSGQ
jgi:hypothetical protein